MSQPIKLRVHAFELYSRANGPGLRAVLWAQGCSLACPACFNPATHPPKGGVLVPVWRLVERITSAASDIEGLTVSGGEPFQQRSALLALLDTLRIQTSLSTIVLTGYTWNEIQQLGEAPDLLSHIDVLIAGRYDDEQRLVDDLRGSSNKTVHFLTDRYSPRDLLRPPSAEIIIARSGEVRLTGMDPPRL